MTKDILRVFSALCSFFPVQARWPSWTSICRQWLMSPLVDLTLLREWCCFQCTSKKLGTVGLGLKWFFPLFHLENLSKLYALSEALAISGYMVYDDVQYISGQTTQCVAPGVPAQRALGLGQWPLVRCEWGTELAQGLAGNLGILSGSTSKILKDVDILWQFSHTISSYLKSACLLWSRAGHLREAESGWNLRHWMESSRGFLLLQVPWSQRSAAVALAWRSCFVKGFGHDQVIEELNCLVLYYLFMFSYFFIGVSSLSFFMAVPMGVLFFTAAECWIHRLKNHRLTWHYNFDTSTLRCEVRIRVEQQPSSQPSFWSGVRGFNKIRNPRNWKLKLKQAKPRQNCTPPAKQVTHPTRPLQDMGAELVSIGTLSEQIFVGMPR